MLGRILKCITITIFIMVSNVSVGTTFHDPLNYGRALEILKTAKSQFEEIKRMYGELERVHDELANTKRLIGNLGRETDSIMGELSNWHTYYDKIDILGANQFSVIDLLGLDNRLPAYNPSNAFDAVHKKLFDNKSEQLELNRQIMARRTITSGIVISEANKSSLSEAKKKIIVTTDSALKANDLLSAMRNQNKLLGIIASEMVQSRAMQAQQLELLSSFFSQFEGTGDLQHPNVSKPIWK